MKYIFKIILVTLLFSLTSCQILHLLNTTVQKDESSEEISTYLDKNKFASYDYSFTTVDSLWYLFNTKKYGLSMWKLEEDGMASAIQLRIYKPNGDLENAYEQCFGPFKKLNILDSYPPRKIPHLRINNNLKFSNELDLWEIDADTKKQILTETQNNTYTIVLYWNIWTNHFSKVMFREMEKYMKEHQNEDVDFLYIIVNNAKKKESSPI